LRPPGVWVRTGIGLARRAGELQRRAGAVLAATLLSAIALGLAAPGSASALSSGVLAWGSDFAGQLGDETETDSNVPVEVKGLESVSAIAGGGEHSLALLKSGKVMAWGANINGQLGDESETNSDVPVEVKGLGEVTAIAAGGEHSLALLKSGKVMAWGSNSRGQLGDETETNSDVPVEVKGLGEVTAIAAGGEHSLALLRSGKVMAWGANFNGELGDETEEGSDVPVEVKGLEDVTAIAGGGEHSLALLRSGKVMAWGSNAAGQLGDESETNSNIPVEVKGLEEVVAIAGGRSFSLALLKNAKVMSWGENFYGQLGNESETNSNVPVEVKGLEEATAIAAGGEHSLALLKGGKVMAWGDNAFGQLGNEEGIARSDVPLEVMGLEEASAIAAGHEHSLALIAAPLTAAPTTLTTSLSGAGQSGEKLTVKEGTPVTDQATLSGENVSEAGGTVAYSVYSDSQCSKLVMQAGTAEVTAGIVPASEAESLSPGTYYWQATYSGDEANEKSSSACGAEVETVTKPSTCGKTTVGRLSDTLVSNRKRVNKCVLPVSAAVSELTVYLAPTATKGTQLIKGVVYADAKGKPRALAGVTEELAFTSASSAGWYRLGFSSPLKLGAGTYWIGLLTGQSNRVAGERFDFARNAEDYNANAYEAGPSNPFGSFKRADERVSLYATYTPQPR
jgi:alpha-tubulin suppressor-like RCC1 family protein